MIKIWLKSAAFSLLILAGTTHSITIAQKAPAGGGGLVLEDSNTTSAESVTAITLTKPSGASNDDIYVILASDSQNTNFTTPTDWTTIKAGNIFGCSVAGAWKIVDGTEASTIDYSNGASRDKVGAYLWVSGNATSGPVDVVSSAVGGANGSSYAIGSVTTVTDDALAFYVTGADTGAMSPFSVSGTGWAEGGDITTGATTGDSAMTWGSRLMTTAGATGDATVTASASNGFCSFQFAIKPL